MSSLQRQRRRRKNGHQVHRLVLFGLLAIGVAAVGGILGAVGWVVSVADSAPSLNQLQPRVPGAQSSVYASNGQLLGYMSSDVIRNQLTQAQQPKLLREAQVDIEDRRFFSHGGVDYMGIVRAGVRDIFSPSRGIQGGSTLTMQVVGNMYLWKQAQNHNLTYKIEQAKLANELEKKHSKNWILTQYLNDVPYGAVGGQQAVGAGAASQMFFDKPVNKLDLAQTALIVGLPQAPSSYNPLVHPKLAKERRSVVLQSMVQAGTITKAQAAQANREPLHLKPNRTYQSIKQPYVFEFIRQQLIKKLGVATVDQGGLKVYTTLNLADQAAAKRSLMANEGAVSDPAAALTSIDPNNGHIVAMAQNTKYGVGKDETTFNYAADEQRQSGSSFKPFVMMAMMQDYDGDPNLTYYNSHELLPGWLPSDPSWKVQTSEHSYEGNINVTKAMVLSDNTVFAQLGVDVGMKKVDAMAHKMGITSPLFGYPTESIGGLRIGVSPLQMADAYAPMDNGGTHYDATILDHIVKPDGKTISGTDAKPRRVFSAGQAYAATKVLQGVLKGQGTGTSASYGCPAAGKTGTTEN
ncbi:MAG: penicillin-binding protein, partial [Solirubrobacterales bacterium]|nr:penicillin-binding protein [Solirubrobacterales bacterium]